MRKTKPYYVIVQDASGTTSQYLFDATSRRQAKADARKWVAATPWNPTLLSVTAAVESGAARRLLTVAGVTLAFGSIAIGTAMIVGLYFEGAL